MNINMIYNINYIFKNIFIFLVNKLYDDLFGKFFLENFDEIKNVHVSSNIYKILELVYERKKEYEEIRSNLDEINSSIYQIKFNPKNIIDNINERLNTIYLDISSNISSSKQEKKQEIQSQRVENSVLEKKNDFNKSSKNFSNFEENNNFEIYTVKKIDNISNDNINNDSFHNFNTLNNISRKNKIDIENNLEDKNFLNNFNSIKSCSKISINSNDESANMHLLSKLMSSNKKNNTSIYNENNQYNYNNISNSNTLEHNDSNNKIKKIYLNKNETINNNDYDDINNHKINNNLIYDKNNTLGKSLIIKNSNDENSENNINYVVNNKNNTNYLNNEMKCSKVGNFENDFIRNISSQIKSNNLLNENISQNYKKITNNSTLNNNNIATSNGVQSVNSTNNNDYIEDSHQAQLFNSNNIRGCVNDKNLHCKNIQNNDIYDFHNNSNNLDKCKRIIYKNEIPQINDLKKNNTFRDFENNSTLNKQHNSINMNVSKIDNESFNRKIDIIRNIQNIDKKNYEANLIVSLKENTNLLISFNPSTKHNNTHEVSFPIDSKESKFYWNCRLLQKGSDIFITGGHNDYNIPSKKCFYLNTNIFDYLSNNNYSTKKNINITELKLMNFSRWAHSLLLIEDKFLFSISGYNNKKCEYLDIQNNKWKNISEINIWRMDCNLFVFNNSYIYAFGGFNDNNKIQKPFVKKIEKLKIFNKGIGIPSNSNKWEFVNVFYNKNEITNSNLSILIPSMGIIILNENKLLLIGGDTSDYSNFYEENSNRVNNINDVNENLEDNNLKYINYNSTNNTINRINKLEYHDKMYLVKINFLGNCEITEHNQKLKKPCCFTTSKNFIMIQNNFYGFDHSLDIMVIKNEELKIE